MNESFEWKGLYTTHSELVYKITALDLIACVLWCAVPCCAPLQVYDPEVDQDRGFGLLGDSDHLWTSDQREIQKHQVGVDTQGKSKGSTEIIRGVWRGVWRSRQVGVCRQGYVCTSGAA
jgi:hypothetical protein